MHQTHSDLRSWLEPRKFLFTFFLLFISFPTALCFASTYACGDASSSHCYGTTTWSERTQYFGSYVDLQEPTMNCPDNCGGFVDNEMWLEDTSSAGCKANPFGVCWEETGYIAQPGQATQFFWADARAQNDSTFNLHILGNADPAGTTDHFMIIKDARVRPQVFQIWVYNTSLSTLYQGTSIASNGNPMSGNLIIIGQELAGTQGASAGNAHFTRNIWAVQTLGPEYVFWYNRQTDVGDVRNDKPPFASWNVNPSSPPPPEGGDFTTHCCG